MRSSGRQSASRLRGPWNRNADSRGGHSPLSSGPGAGSFSPGQRDAYRCHDSADAAAVARGKQIDAITGDHGFLLNDMISVVV